MIFIDDETTNEDEMPETDDETGLADDLLDEVSEDDEAVDGETVGFGLIADDEVAEVEETEAEEADDEADAALEEDAEDVDYDTFDDIDEM